MLATFLKKLPKICPQYDIGEKFIALFAECGLPVPEVSFEVPVAGGKAHDLCYWAVETLRSLCENPQHTVLVDGTEVDFSTLVTELQEQINANNSQVEFVGQFCTWAKIP